MSLQGKVALITGGGERRGAERARQLAQEGADLAFHYSCSKTKETIQQLRNEILKAHPNITVSMHSGDLGTAAAVEKLFAEVVAQRKRIDVVVNTADMVLKKPVAEADYEKMFAYAVFVDEQRRRTVDLYHAEVTRKQRS